MRGIIFAIITPVSYTHLDVYKRQAHQDHVAQSAGSGQHLSGHQSGPGVADSNLDAGESHDQRGRNPHFYEDSEVRSAKGLAYVFQDLLGLPDAGIGVD